jgi:hypothetical protein
MDVGVDTHDFRPWRFDEIRTLMAERVKMASSTGASLPVKHSRRSLSFRRTGFTHIAYSTTQIAQNMGVSPADILGQPACDNTFGICIGKY